MIYDETLVINKNLETPIEKDEDNFEIVEKIIKVPREIIKNEEIVKEVIRNDERPILEVLNQCKEMKNQIAEYKANPNNPNVNNERIIENI